MPADKKKILIVCKGFYPLNSPRAFRAAELAKEFARQGHDVTVLTPKDPEVHPPFEKEYGLTIKDLGQPRWKEVEIKGSGLVLLVRRALRRFSNLLFEYPNIELMGMVKKALRKESGYDLMISIAVPYPIHWGVASVRSEKHPVAKTWIADCGDPYMGVENDTFSRPFYFAIPEKKFCRKADYITVPVEGAIDAYFPEFRDKFRVIPQGFRFEDIELQEKPQNNGRPVFGYAGSFIPGRRDPSEFLAWLANLDKDYEFHIYTTHPNMVEPWIEKGAGRIRLKDLVPRTELLHRMSGMDFVVNFENVGNRQTPSKLIDYAIINKPVLSVRTGDLDTNTASGFLDGDYSNRYTIEDPDQYRIGNVCAKFLNLREESLKS
ncbi:MAG: glycosyltransferase [Cyclonatronaceae bacterium]